MLKIIKSKLSVFLFALLVIAQSLLIISCSSGELSRSQAQKMIVESNDFKQPATLEYVQGNILIGRNKGAVVAKSETEQEPEAIQRRIAEHYAANPQMAVADYFGLINAQLKRTNDKPDPVTVATNNWYFSEHYSITEKGRKMWQGVNLPVNEAAVPIAGKQLVEVTGITRQNENFQVEFTWKWSPNEVGKSLDSSTEEFTKLPEKIKQDLIAPGGLKSRNQTLSWQDGNRQGKATIRAYDDGLRLTEISFF